MTAPPLTLFPKKPTFALCTDEEWVDLQERMIAAVIQIVQDAGWEVDEVTFGTINSLCVEMTHRQVEDDDSEEMFRRIQKIAAEVEAEGGRA